MNTDVLTTRVADGIVVVTLGGGATKIHGELLKLGIQVAQSTVSTYMVPRRDRPLQTWKSFVRNHMEGIAAGADDCVSTTIRVSGSRARSAAVGVVCGDPLSDGG